MRAVSKSKDALNWLRLILDAARHEDYRRNPSVDRPAFQGLFVCYLLYHLVSFLDHISFQIERVRELLDPLNALVDGLVGGTHLSAL